MTSYAQLLTSVLASDATRPRLTWYGNGERVEFSARTLINWVNKTANLFVEEFDLGPGDQVAIALPMHWRRVVFELALGLIGAEEAEDSTRLLVTAHPEAATAGDTADDTVVVELASLARRVSAPLAAGALDYNAEVAGYDDVFVPVSPRTVSCEPIGERVLVRTDDPQASVKVLGALAGDGSIVLATPDTDERSLGAEQIQGR